MEMTSAAVSLLSHRMMLRRASTLFIHRIGRPSILRCRPRPVLAAATTSCLLLTTFTARSNVSNMATSAASGSTTTSSTSEVTIRELNSSVTTFSRPFLRTGCEVGVRMSAIRLPSGDLILYNPTELDADTRAKLASLGTVRYIIMPNLVHHTFVAPYVKEFPTAKIIGPDGLQKKKESEGVHLTLEMKDPKTDYSQQIGWGTDIDYIYFPDFAQKEILLFHRPTKTLFVADMLWNLPATEQYSNVRDKSRAPLNASKFGLQSVANHHLSPDGWLGKMLQWVADKPTDDFKAGMHRLIEQWTPATIVPEHGDVITEAADAKLRHTYSWVKWDK